MPFDQFICVVTGEPVSVADCLAHAIGEGGQLAELGCHFRPTFLRGIADALKDDPMPGGAVRVTQLLGCAKRAQWQQANPYNLSPRDAFALFRGQIGHAIVERFHDSEILLAEERLTAEIGGMMITGKPDAVLDTEHCHIDDYKTTAYIPREPYEHHVQQVNVYAWLIGKVRGVKIETASIVYFDMKEPRCLNAPVWSRKQTETFLRERILLWQAGTPSPQTWECKSCPLSASCEAALQPAPRASRRKS